MSNKSWLERILQIKKMTSHKVLVVNENGTSIANDEPRTIETAR